MILFDEMHFSVYVPSRLRDQDCKTIGRILHSRRFHNELTRLIHDLFRRWPMLEVTRIKLTR